MEDSKGTKETTAIANLIKSGKAGWVNDPERSGSILVEPWTGCALLSSDGTKIRRRQRVIYTRAIKIDRGKFQTHVNTYEGFVQHMYLDVEGNVTVGIGHLIKDAAAAMRLPFYTRKTSESSGSDKTDDLFDKIEKDFNTVRAATTKAKYGASAFKKITKIDLGIREINALLGADVRQVIAELKYEFPNYETYPGLVQLGMLDLAYNMGARKFASQFTEFRKGLDSRNWAKVAKESRRTETDSSGTPLGKVKERNNVVQAWFTLAAEDEPFYVKADCLPLRIPG